MLEITASQFEDWKADNAYNFGSVYVWVNFDAANSYFSQKDRAVRTAGKNAVDIGERIRKGGNAFQAARYDKFTPEEGEVYGLYFTFLLAELPLARVQRNATGLLPKNATLDGFHGQFTARYKTWLGERPSLAKWQRVTETFLREWCPPGKPNAFKWKDANAPRGIWSLSAAEIDLIAYKTTYQFGLVAMNSAIWSTGPVLIPSGD